MRPIKMAVFAVGLMAFQNTQAQMDKDRLVHEMASFDRAYVAALALTNDGKLTPSRKAMARLDNAWKIFRKRTVASLGADSGWASGLAEIDTRIRHAGEIVARGTAIDEAHEALEKVRLIFMELRQSDGIVFFPDMLTAFHEPMEAIALAAKGKTPDTFGPDDLAKIVGALPEAKNLWQKVIAARLAGGTYGLDADAERTAKVLQSQESRALEKLEKAIETKDAAQIIPAAMGVKPPFARLYKLFGDFSGLG